MVAYIGVIRAIIEDLKQNRRPIFFVLGALNALHFAFCCYEEELSVADSLWFGATLATGSGYGDVVLTSAEGRISVVTFAMFFNCLLGWALWVASDYLVAADVWMIEKWNSVIMNEPQGGKEPHII